MKKYFHRHKKTHPGFFAFALLPEPTKKSADCLYFDSPLFCMCVYDMDEFWKYGGASQHGPLVLLCIAQDCCRGVMKIVFYRYKKA